jgi:hypothetical protein
MRKLFTGLLLLAAAFSFAQEDPHAQLTDALAKRRLGVTIQIPDGYVFTRPLVIPPGTRGFSLAIKGRLVKASDNFAAIEVGDTRHHWQFPFQALPVALEGQATLPLPDGWWFIYDDAQVVHATVPSSRVSYRGELVKVTSGALDQPLGRTYDLSVKAARVDVCERVSVSGLQTTGMALQIAYGVDCRVRDSGVSSFGGFAFRSVRSRRTVFENVRVQQRDVGPRDRHPGQLRRHFPAWLHLPFGLDGLHRRGQRGQFPGGGGLRHARDGRAEDHLPQGARPVGHRDRQRGMAPRRNRTPHRRLRRDRPLLWAGSRGDGSQDEGSGAGLLRDQVGAAARGQV